MEGIGRGNLGSYNATAYTNLVKFLEKNPLKSDGDAWLAKLMEVDEMLGVRVLEVRLAYAAHDFEWDNCQRVALSDLNKKNVEILRQHAEKNITWLPE